MKNNIGNIPQKIPVTYFLIESEVVRFGYFLQNNVLKAVYLILLFTVMLSFFVLNISNLLEKVNIKEGRNYFNLVIVVSF